MPSPSSINWKAAVAIPASAILWMAFHAQVLRGFGFSAKLSATDSAVSNLMMLLGASILGTIALYYLPKAQKFHRTILLILVDALVLSLLCVWLTKNILESIIRDHEAYLQFLQFSMPVRSAINFLVIASVGIALILISQVKEQQETAKREAATSTMVKEAELQKLQLQFQPHFLFNCLNSINAMVIVRPQEAQLMVQQLSEFLRTTIRRADEQWISLSDELHYLQLYLSIEKIRFGHRLEVETTSDDQSAKWKMPTLLLQPLVENAIKFGLYGTTEKVTITLNAKVNNNALNITVTNPFDPDMQPPQGSGFGLSGLKRRLYLLFARNDLVTTEMVNNIFVVTVKIPNLS